MKHLIKEILRKILSKTLFNLFIKIYRKFNNRIKILLLNLKYFFSKSQDYKNIVSIGEPLILISQIQRSGGTLVSQLFDGTQEVYAYPSELVLTNPKWDWLKEKNYICYKSFEIRSYAEDRNYIKESVAKNELKNKFIFDLIKQRQVFDSLAKPTERKNLDAYFTSFFNSFLNFGNLTGKKKYIIAFTPRIIMHEGSIKNFFEIYPDGNIFTVIREPISWLASAVTHSDEYKDHIHALKLWLKSTKDSLKHAKNNSRVTLIMFEELIQDTEITMNRLCKKLGINFEKEMLTPTFNSELTLSDSSFKAQSGIVKTASDRKKKINVSSVDTELLEECKDFYHQALEHYRAWL